MPKFKFAEDLKHYQISSGQPGKPMYSFHSPFDLAEDHDFRSRYVQNIVQTPDPRSTVTSLDKATIPKVIVQFWHDSKAIPEDVQECLESWTNLKKQGFMTVLFDDKQARQFISDKLGQRYLQAFELCYHPAMRCDYFRLCYILINGGFYVDADEVYQGTECDRFFLDGRLKVQPLCYDTISGNMISPDLFIRRGRSSSNWIFYMNNNPIISPVRHPIVHLALERATRILLNSLERPEIQSTTGPGNLTASLVSHAIFSQSSGHEPDFMVLPDWETTSISPWSLSYRNDERNWRLLNSIQLKEDSSL